MALIKKPSDIEPKKAVSVLIYGQPGIGKTTLGCSAKNAILFDFDNGVNRVHSAHQIPTLQVEKWEDTIEAIKEIQSDPELRNTRTIVIDTVGKMLDYLGEFIMRNDPKMRNRDGSLALKGYGARKTRFVDFNKMLTMSGYNVVYIAHEKEDKDKETVTKRPLIGGSSANDLMQELDLVGYMQAVGNERTITFWPTESYYAKNSCFIADQKIPVVVDASGVNAKPNTFMEDVIFQAFRDAQKNKTELTKKYNLLLTETEALIAKVDSIETLNKVLKEVGSTEPIFDSKIKAGIALKAKAEELGAKFDKEAKAYVAA